MQLPKFLTRKKNKGDKPESNRNPEQEIIQRNAVQKGRKAVDFVSRSASPTIVARQFLEYHGYDLDSLISMSSSDLMKLLFVLDPTASHALSNFLKVFDTGYYAVAKDFNGQSNKEAQGFLDGLMNRYDRPTGEGFSGDTSISSLYSRAVTYALFHGAVAIEVEFDQFFRNQNIHLVDPLKVEFERDEKNNLTPFYLSGRDRISLNAKNFLYFPVDPLPGDVYGTSQFISAIQPIMNKVRLLQDFARALRNLGFDRIDITIDEEALIDACKKRGIKDADAIEKVIQQVIGNTQSSFSDLKVDDNPAHLSSIKLAPLDGKNSGRSLDIKAIVDVMMSDIASGLKTFATVLGKAFNRSSEGYQSIEALLFIKMVEGFQSYIERIMERVLTLIVQVEGGHQVNVDFEFLEASLRPLYESAQYFQAFQTMIYEAENRGYISEAEGGRLIRRMLKLKGDPPPDAERKEPVIPIATADGDGPPPNTPERDRSQEDGKEQRRARTRSERRTSPPE
jgi:hypothetical protein